MSEAQSLPGTAWEVGQGVAQSWSPLPSWHPRVLWTWANALGSTACTLSRLRGAQDSALVLNRWSRNLLRALRVQVEIRGTIPDAAQIWISNHLSWLDAPVLLAQRPMGTLAKVEVGGYPMLGRQARRAGLRFVNREDPMSRATALLEITRHWRSGAPFLLFPEGTTTRGEGLAPIYKGGLRAAYRLGLSVLPMRLESPDGHYPWTGDETLLPHLQAICRARRTRVQTHPGSLLSPSGGEESWLNAIRAHLETPQKMRAL